MAQTMVTRDQYYIFMHDGIVLVECFLSDGTHVTAPGPFRSMADQARWLEDNHPGAVVDFLDTPEDVASALTFGR